VGKKQSSYYCREGADIEQSVNKLSYELEGPRFESRLGFSILQIFQTGYEVHQPVAQSIPELYPGVVARGLDGDHSPPFNGEVKNGK
jgi:hypothetical protein